VSLRNCCLLLRTRLKRRNRLKKFGEYPDSGFTLLELLLAIFLLSFLGIAVFTGINLAIKAYRSQMDNFTRVQQVRLAWRYLERSLSSAGDHLQTEGPWPYFVGEEQEIRFLTPLPLEAHNLGGYYYWRVWVGRGEDGSGSLVVDESKAVFWEKDPQVQTRQVLLRGIRSWQFLYNDSGKEYTRWDGRRLKGLPQTVRVRFSLGNNAPQEWLIPLHTAVLTSGR
jgi:prepilin-type N-terminal cleavage/methylation domain-containing protein